MRTLLAIVALLTWSVAAQASTITATAEAKGPTLVIDDDDGGTVDDHVKFYKRILASGIQVRIVGICTSSCTLVMMLPQAQFCVEPQVSFGFHSYSYGGTPAPELTKALTVRYFPKPIVAWVKARWPLKISPILYLTAPELVEMGVVRLCD